MNARAPSGLGRKVRERIEDEHRFLRGRLTRLEELGEPRDILSELRELRPFLEAHFKTEEGVEGMPELIRCCAPHHYDRLKSIFLEHGKFLLEIDHLVAAIEAASVPPAAIADGVAALLTRLREHEAMETNLLSIAINTDLGGCD